MSNKYKILILGKNIYREYSLLGNEDENIKIGTKRGAQIRFKEEIFFESFSFEIVKSANGWNLISTAGVYFTIDGVMKLYSKNLTHGDEIIVKYENFNGELFKLNFFIDFDSVEKKYDRKISLKSVDEITIGGNEQNNIYIIDDLLKGDSITLKKDGKNYIIKDNNCKYGVYINAKKVTRTATISNKNFIVMVGYYFYLDEDYIYTDSLENLILSNLSYEDIKEFNRMKYPKFNRNSRIRYKIPNKGIEILPPEKMKEAPRGRLILTLIPAIAMLGLTIVLRGIMGGGGTFVIYSAATMSIGIIMSVVTAIVDKKEYKKEIAERRAGYLAYLEEKEKAIKNIRKKELEISNVIYRPIDEVIKKIQLFDKDLFDRSITDEDFLNVRLGSGKKIANCKTEIKPQEFKDTKDDLMAMPEAMEEKYRIIEKMPITVNLRKNNAVGIVGEERDLKNLLTNMTIDIIGRHFYKEVKLFYIIKEKDVEEFSWLRWIRHCYNEELGIRNVIYNEESKNILFEYLYVELLKRSEEKNEKEEDKKEGKNVEIVIFVLDNKGIYNHPISRFIQKSNQLSVTFIFLESAQELIPKGCDNLIDLKGQEKGILINCENGEDFYEFKYPDILNLNLNLNEMSLKLAPIFVDEVTLENQLTKNISLYQLLQIQAAEDLDIEKRWKNSMVYKTMAAPLGVKTKDEKVYLDLNEKNHGPHGLVAGTTGSGKSEILQSYILSMATLYHPYEVSFVIIDFKGGGMVNQFKDLPHLIGSITNIDGREIVRSLLSIKAELRKRQELFAEANVNHVDKYIQKYKKGEVKIPLPHLILIVDEFAELKSDQPEFMKELISAARIGRSLGVHLILATQKPSGVVDEQIWSNSKFKLCLKVQNKADSNEVLKTPLAAEIKEPGRAYLQVGNNEIFELFQSAYSGAPAVNDEIGNSKEFEISEVNTWGKRKIIYKQEKKKKVGNVDTQLEVLVQYINDYCIEKQIEKLPGICLPPLPELISVDQLKEKNKKNKIQTEISIGLFDDPTRQLQAQVLLNLLEGNLFILGASQFGKTALLQLIIRRLTEVYTPKELNIYIIDFGSMILKTFNELNHVGGVVLASEDEKLKTFINMLLSEISVRKAKLSKLGLSSFISYREAGYDDMPHIVVCLDNITAFKELYQEFDDSLLKICREAIAVGITMIFANSQSNGIGYKYMANFSNRICLYCNDSSEYSYLFDRCKLKPKAVPGRALIAIDKQIYEYQNYLAFSGEKEIDRVKSMKEFIKESNERNKGMKAKIIPEIPEILDIKYIKENYKDKLKNYEIPIALNFENIELETINLNKNPVLALIGKEGKGKSSFVKNIAERVQDNILDQLVEAYVVDSVDKKLSFMKDYGYTERYSSIYSDFNDIIEDIYDVLERRNEIVIEEGLEAIEEEPLLLVIVNNKEAIVNSSNNKPLMEKFKKIITNYKNLKVSFLFSDIENNTVGFSSPEIMKIIKENKKGIIFENATEIKTFEVTMTIARNYKKSLEKSEAYLISESAFKKIKIIKEK